MTIELSEKLDARQPFMQVLATTCPAHMDALKLSVLVFIICRFVGD